MSANVDALLARVGDRIAEFYKRAQGVICVEISRVQPIGVDRSPEGFARTVESELRVEPGKGEAPGEAAMVRVVRKVNGRVPRERDKKTRDGCTDPNPLSTEPLAFLLPAHRSEYKFVAAGSAKDRGRDALLIDFRSANRRSNPELIEDKNGHDDCFDWTGHIATEGRVWVDAQSYDVLRVEEHAGPIDIKVPVKIQERHHLGSWMTMERQDVTTRYKLISFKDPDEVFLLPESIDAVILIRGGLQSSRRSQIFSDYKRFITGGRVVD